MKKLLIILLLTGCGIVGKVDGILYPEPIIDKQARFGIYTDPGTKQIYAVTIIQVKRADKVFWYYGCEQRNLDWIREVGNSNVYEGQSRHESPLLACWTTLYVRVIAYNRWQKKGQKAAAMQWKLNIKKLLE